MTPLEWANKCVDEAVANQPSRNNIMAVIVRALKEVEDQRDAAIRERDEARRQATMWEDASIKNEGAYIVVAGQNAAMRAALESLLPKNVGGECFYCGVGSKPDERLMHFDADNCWDGDQECLRHRKYEKARAALQSDAGAAELEVVRAAAPLIDALRPSAGLLVDAALILNARAALAKLRERRMAL